MRRAILAFLAMTAAFAGAAQAAGSRAPDEGAARAEQAVLALRLADWAHAHRDPHGLVLAARLLQQAGLRDGDPRAAASAGLATRDSLLADARKLAGGDRALLAEISATATAADKEIVGPIVRNFQEVSAGATWSIPFRARGGRPVLLAILGDGDSPLEVEIEGTGSAQACPSGQAAAEIKCRFTPPGPFDSNFVARIANRGKVWSRVVVILN